MARIPYVTDANTSARMARLFDAQRRLGGRVTNFHRLLAHVPWIFHWYVPFQAALTKTEESLVGRRTRHLVQIRTSMVNACAYCTSHTSDVGRRDGVTDEELEGLRGDASSISSFSSAEQAAIAWATAVARNEARRDMQTFERLREHFSDEQIVELTVLAAARTMVNLIQEALWTDLEAEHEVAPPLTTAPVTDLAEFIRSLR